MSVRMRAAALSMRSRYCCAHLASSSGPAASLEPLAERQDLAQRLLQVVRRHERELVQRRVRALELAALRRETMLGEAPLGDVLDRQQDDARRVRPMRHAPRIEQHDLAADAGEHVVDLDVVQLRLRREPVANSARRARDVPLAIAQANSTSPIVSSAATRKV